MKKPCVVIAGPTCVGKTEISLLLAEKINGSIISADSVQVYRGLDIGSAKIKREQMRRIPHYLIDSLDPKEEFDVVSFQQMAKTAMEEIYQSGRIPIVVGGTGFYIQALIKNVDFAKNAPNSFIREKYNLVLEKEGPAKLHEILRNVDQVSAEAIHQNNVKRVIRALEFFESNHIPISKHNEIQNNKKSPYLYAYFVINDDRKILYSKINRRVKKMMESGLKDEVKELISSGLDETYTSMKGIGYREFFPYFDGRASLDDTVRKIKSDSRHYAKRQITWFKRENEAIWLNRQDYGGNNELIADAIFNKWNEIYNGK